MTKKMNDPEATLLAMGLGEEDLVAWRQAGWPDESLGTWLTNRIARQPAGGRARQIYGAPDVHDFARRAILGVLVLGPEDHLLELGCGGGLLLRDALATGARATGLDHSHEMVELARTNAGGAHVIVVAGEHVPFLSSTFTAVDVSARFGLAGRGGHRSHRLRVIVPFIPS